MAAIEKPAVGYEQVDFAVSAEIARLEDMTDRMHPSVALIYLEGVSRYLNSKIHELMED